MILTNDLFQSLIVIFVFAVLLLTACASNDTRTQALIAQRTANASTSENDRLNSEIALKNAELRGTVSPSDYKIGAEDLLEIDVFQVQELKTTERVSARGYIKLPLIDDVRASGQTVAGLETLIAKKLSKYVRDPQVGVFVKEYRSQQISVLGAVRDPKVYYVSGQKYLLDMLSLAGGLTQEAGSVCIIQQVSSASSGRVSGQKMVIDLDALLRNGRTDLNVPVYSGDVIQVPKKGIFFVDGAVRSPGEFPIDRTTTLTEAISIAKGFRFEAARSNIKIYRDIGKAKREVITLDYDDILSGKSHDPVLKDKDIVIVASSAFKKFLQGLSGALNLNGVSLGGRGAFY
ncbi:MAG: polysaccharide export protein [Acidobacteriota bacterium]